MSHIIRLLYSQIADGNRRRRRYRCILSRGWHHWCISRALFYRVLINIRWSCCWVGRTYRFWWLLRRVYVNVKRMFGCFRSGLGSFCSPISGRWSAEVQEIELRQSVRNECNAMREMETMSWCHDHHKQSKFYLTSHFEMPTRSSGSDWRPKQ